MRTIRKHALAMAALTVLALFSLALPGCDNTPAPQEKPADAKPVISILVYREDDTYLRIVTKAIQEALNGKADVTVLHAKSDQLLQNEQLEGVINQKVSAVALNLVDTMAAGTAVDSLQRAGIPVVFFNREPDLATIKSYPKAGFVGTDVSAAGTMQGDIIKELWDAHPAYDRNGDGKCQYIMIQANLDNPESLARTEYSVRQARENGLVMQQVGETLLCNWNDVMAHEMMRLVFPLYEDNLELIIANNDSMALGAIRALNEFGYNLEGSDAAKFIPVVGVDAVPGAVEAINKGMMSATVVQDGEGMANAIAAMLLNAAAGKDLLEGVPHEWDASGVAIRIPYSRLEGKR